MRGGKAIEAPILDVGRNFFTLYQKRSGKGGAENGDPQKLNSQLLPLRDQIF